MSKKIIASVIGVVIGVAAVWVWLLNFKPPLPEVKNFDECVKAGYPVMESYPRQCKIPDGKTFVEDLIKIFQPRPNDFIKSPLEIKGEARGYWFFEASFPVQLLDANGKELGTTIAQAKGDWMTENFVPFEAVLEFQTPTTEKGTLILEKDNPSGLPEYEDELKIPVLFKRTRLVELYYYNSELDQGEDGNILCSRKGLVAVERKIPLTITPIKDTINLLLKGELTDEEKASGITTEYPLSGLSLKNAVLDSGVLTLTFDDQNNKTVGGSCRVGVLWFQIEATAKQFSGVKKVQFLPEELFQP